MIVSLQGGPLHGTQVSVGSTQLPDLIHAERGWSLSASGKSFAELGDDDVKQSYRRETVTSRRFNGEEEIRFYVWDPKP